MDSMRARVLGLGVLVALAAMGFARAGELREIEITPDPPDPRGLQIYTLRLRPDANEECDKIVFECMYHQEFPWDMTNETTRIRVIEPAFFTYQRKDVKLVEDLDYYVSFRVPVGMPLLQEKYGATTFNTNFPVTVSRIKLKATAKGKTIWCYEVAAQGLHDVANEAGTELPKEAKPEDKEVKRAKPH